MVLLQWALESQAELWNSFVLASHLTCIQIKLWSFRIATCSLFCPLIDSYFKLGKEVHEFLYSYISYLQVQSQHCHSPDKCKSLWYIRLIQFFCLWQLFINISLWRDELHFCSWSSSFELCVKCLSTLLSLTCKRSELTGTQFQDVLCLGSWRVIRHILLGNRAYATPPSCLFPMTTMIHFPRYNPLLDRWFRITLTRKVSSLVSRTIHEHFHTDPVSFPHTCKLISKLISRFWHITIKSA